MSQDTLQTEINQGVGTIRMNRPDVHNAQRAQDDWHGFAFRTPKLAPGEHKAQVYAVHSNGAGARRTLQLIGKPYKFTIQ